MPIFNCNFDFIPVPGDFIENHLPEANGSYVKVYLLALSLAVRKTQMSTAEIASALSLLESDVINALSYWDKRGVLSYDKENVLFGGASKISYLAEKEDQGKPSNEDISDNYISDGYSDTREEDNSSNRKSIKQISEEMTQNQSLADLCALSQEILGKTLKNKDIETLYWFYDELGLSPEVIIMLLEYCVSKEKRSMKYIEKVAIAWHENGIVTLEAVDKYINSEKDKNTYFYTLKKLFGFDGRNFSKTEETYLKTWRDKYEMDENMVGLAYEYCVMQINKISFPYMDSILKRWNELDIHTVEAAEKDHEDFKSKNRQNNLSVYDDSDVDYNEIERIAREKM